MLEPTEFAGRMLESIGMVPAFDDLVISTPEALPLVEPGEYEAHCVSCRKERRFRREVLLLKFKITNQCPHFGTILDAYINLDFGRGNSRKAPTRSKLASWLRVIARFDPSVDTAKFRLSTFGNYLFVVKVETSEEDSTQSACEPCSRVTQILDVVGRLGGGAR